MIRSKITLACFSSLALGAQDLFETDDALKKTRARSVRSSAPKLRSSFLVSHPGCEGEVLGCYSMNTGD